MGLGGLVFALGVGGDLEHIAPERPEELVERGPALGGRGRRGAGGGDVQRLAVGPMRRAQGLEKGRAAQGPEEVLPVAGDALETDL